MSYQYSYGYPGIIANASTLLAASYLNSLRQRVTAGSGTMVDETATLELYRTLIDQNLISSLRRGYSDLAAVRLNDLGGGNLGVQERFDLNDGTFGGASSSVNAVQSTAANQALWATDADTGRRQTTYDGSNDLHSIADLGIFRNQAAGSIFIIVKDLNRAGGDATHNAIRLTTAGGSSRADLFTRASSTQNYFSTARRLDADTASDRSSASLDGYNSLCSILAWGGNAHILQVNATQTASTTFSSGGGTTSDTDSNLFNIGANTSASNRLNGMIPEALFFRTALSATQINALRTFYKQYYPTLP